MHNGPEKFFKYVNPTPTPKKLVKLNESVSQISLIYLNLCIGFSSICLKYTMLCFVDVVENIYLFTSKRSIASFMQNLHIWVRISLLISQNFFKHFSRKKISISGQKIRIENGQPIIIDRKERASLTPIGSLAAWGGSSGGMVVKAIGKNAAAPKM